MAFESADSQVLAHPVKVLTWAEVYARLEGAPPGLLYGVPRGGAIVAGLSGRPVPLPELADVIGRRLALPGGDLDLDLRTRLAVVRETRLLDKYGALELYAQVLAAQPKHPAALGQLEAWAQREPQNKPLVEVLLAAFRAASELVKLPAMSDNTSCSR